MLIPGVLDTSCNFVEHPELVAQRLLRYASLLGRERVSAGTDCGFGTFCGVWSGASVHLLVEEMKSMAEGAEIASRKLWGRGTG